MEMEINSQGKEGAGRRDHASFQGYYKQKLKIRVFTQRAFFVLDIANG
jgi:hypothetical protein